MPSGAVTLVQDPLTVALLSAIVLILIIRSLDVFEREPLWAVGLMALWGGIGATAIAAPLNTAWAAAMSPDTAAVWGAAITAPVVEELAKGAALVIAVLASSWIGKRSGLFELNGPTDGMVYGAAVGIGFAFVENSVYFLSASVEADVGQALQVLEAREGFLNLGMLGHAVYTGAFGAGIGLATWSRSPAARIGYPILGLAAGMLMHAFNNGFASLVLVGEYGFDAAAAFLREAPLPVGLGQQMLESYDSAWALVGIVGYVLIAGMILALLLWQRYERRILAFELYEEVESGLISREEHAAITAVGGRLRWYGQLLAGGQLAELGRLRASHRELCELAFAKWRARIEGTDAGRLEDLRSSFRLLRGVGAPASGGTPVG